MDTYVVSTRTGIKSPKLCLVYFTVDCDGSIIQALAFTGRLGFRSKKNDVDNNQSINNQYPQDLFTGKQINNETQID